MTSSVMRLRADGRTPTQYFRADSGIRRLLACAVGLLLAAGGSFADTKPPLVTPVAGLNQLLLPKSDGFFEVRVPIVVAEGKSIFVKKLDVVYKEGRSDKLFSAFAVTSKPADNNNGAALVVSAKETLWPGTYVLSLAVAASDKPKDEQSLVLNVTVPAPQVTASTKVVVSQLIYPGGSSVSPGMLEVRETSGRIGVLNVTPMALHC